MTVGELIEQLSQHPRDTRVIVHGYEAGFHDIKGLYKRSIMLNVNYGWYYGPHDVPPRGKTPDEIALLIERK